jgi:hypothetical protein
VVETPGKPRCLILLEHKFDQKGHRTMKNIIVITGASSGFGALTARDIGEGKPDRLPKYA